MSNKSLFPPDGFQVPVNGYVDGQAGRLQEVGEQVPLDDPRLSDAHLLQILSHFLLDFSTSRWEDERDEESLVREFNIASWLPYLALPYPPPLFSLSFYTTEHLPSVSVIKACC